MNLGFFKLPTGYLLPLHNYYLTINSTWCLRLTAPGGIRVDTF